LSTNKHIITMGNSRFSV